MTTIHLLYVDDEENWLNAVGQILQTGEFVVDTATDGEMALQKMAEQRYDMILLDVRLKEENGWELVRRFKQVQREVAVVLFTSDYEVERLTDVFGVGVEDYLEKSSDIGILANRCGCCCHRSEDTWWSRHFLAYWCYYHCCLYCLCCRRREACR